MNETRSHRNSYFTRTVVVNEVSNVLLVFFNTYTFVKFSHQEL